MTLNLLKKASLARCEAWLQWSAEIRDASHCQISTLMLPSGLHSKFTTRLWEPTRQPSCQQDKNEKACRRGAPMRSRNIGQIAGFGWAARQVAALLLTVTLAAPAAQSQQQSRQGAAQRSGSETPARVSVRPPDIISDNLDRVAASADQILEVLNREAGLMVELKRLLAQEAGASGQILEEADLTDVAVAERLRSDLRARVLATRLLQRYGYLVPRVNPDSDLGAEQRLVRQERAQILARAAERRDTLSDSSPAAQNEACDPRRFSECALPSTLPQDRESLPVGPIAPGRVPRTSTPVQQAGDLPQNDMPRPDGTSVLPNQRSEYPASSGSSETVLASMRAGTNPHLDATPTMPG